MVKAVWRLSLINYDAPCYNLMCIRKGMKMSKDENAKSKIAMVLAGGGLAGVVYELGALRAIDDLLLNQTVNDFDIYVGTSAGSIVSAGLANELTPQQMLQSVEGSKQSLPSIGRRDLFKFDTRAVVERVWRLPQFVSKTVTHYVRHPHDLNLVDLLWELSNVLPSALYDSSALEDYIGRLLSRSGITNEFNTLERELYVIATSLENGKRVVFGDGAYRRVPISQAVAASSAMPLMYKPVRIDDEEFLDGGMGGTASIDVAIEKGANLVVVINPLVPFDNMARFWEERRGHLSDQGMQVMLSQVLRILMHSGLRYHVKQIERKYPDVDVILIEPRADDEVMMFSNIMRYSNRLAIAKHGYESVTVDLAEDYGHYKAVLAKHGVEIDRERRVVPQIEKIFRSGNDEEVIEDVLEVNSAKPAASPFGALRGMLDDLDGYLRGEKGRK